MQVNRLNSSHQTQNFKGVYIKLKGQENWLSLAEPHMPEIGSYYTKNVSRSTVSRRIKQAKEQGLKLLQGTFNVPEALFNSGKSYEPQTRVTPFIGRIVITEADVSRVIFKPDRPDGQSLLVALNSFLERVSRGNFNPEAEGATAVIMHRNA